MRRRIGLLVGPLFLAATLLLPAPAGLEGEGWRVAGLGCWMAAWWVTEAIPIPATALLPLAALPLLGVTDMSGAASPYANPLIFLFLGGFLVAAGMERWGLPKRVALAVVAAVGTRPRAVIAGFMVAAAGLSMWVSNTATALIMLPIGVSVLELVGRSDPAQDGPDEGRHFGIALMLGIAYACSIGGVATLIGTPPNAFLAGFFSESYGVEIGFARWMAFGLPVTLVGLPVAHLLLTRVAFRVHLDRIPGGRDFIRREREALGAPSPPERRVAAVFTAVAAAWVTRPLLEEVVPGLSDAGIAVAGGLVLFLLPAGDGSGERLLSWDDAEDLPWGVLVLFGGGLSLASAIQGSGLTGWIGAATGGLAGSPLVVLVAATVAVVVLLTELTSNTATAAAFLPVLASVAVGVGQDPRMLALPAAVAASCAFMLPVATPPNAIVFGSGAVTVPEMARAGLWLNLVFVALAAAAALLWAPTVFGIEVGVLPPWASP